MRKTLTAVVLALAGMVGCNYSNPEYYTKQPVKVNFGEGRENIYAKFEQEGYLGFLALSERRIDVLRLEDWDSKTEVSYVLDDSLFNNYLPFYGCKRVHSPKIFYRLLPITGDGSSSTNQTSDEEPKRVKLDPNNPAHRELYEKLATQFSELCPLVLKELNRVNFQEALGK